MSFFLLTLMRVTISSMYGLMWLFTKDTNIPSCWNRNCNRGEVGKLAPSPLGRTQSPQAHPQSTTASEDNRGIHFQESDSRPLVVMGVQPETTANGLPRQAGRSLHGRGCSTRRLLGATPVPPGSGSFLPSPSPASSLGTGVTGFASQACCKSKWDNTWKALEQGCEHC